MRIVLDTNCLLASLSKRGAYFNVWRGLQEGKYTLCVSNEILDEYEEIIGQKTNSIIASNVIQTLLNAPSVELIDTFFRFDLIKDDPDDNKFVDCAIAGNATFIVSNDQFAFQRSARNRFSETNLEEFARIFRHAAIVSSRALRPLTT